MTNHSKKIFYWTTIGLAGSLALVLIIVLLFMLLGIDNVQAIDENIQHYLFPQADSWYYSLLPVIKGITEFGSFNITMIVALAFVSYYWIFRKLYVNAYIAAVSFIGMWGINYVLKIILRRERPELEQLMAAHGYSFPSGHSMIAAGFYGGIVILLVHAMKERGWTGPLLAILGTLFVLLIGYSRIYLGVHYPSDVVTGLLSGGIWAFCMYRLLQEASQ
ncbi:phosphatase PAP2 family protein [Paenibacillus provencensis]|uniref:Phosphatase PAP2 family protein n=1 Tax=Paenibacillus provencensis TaxID=441151 RepID=A0ABW3PYB0_9BACL|nr:phosphatase PAP2 family protein [Paenibacillus sp. MER 78]MCM3130393.1 phosphatase PAP2 family protein [Paenibacillus sp. MER 78]